MNDKEKVQSIIIKVLAAMDFVVTPVIKDSIDGVCVFAIEVDKHAQLLIGHQGSNLSAIEHIVRVVARQQSINLYFKIDINHYSQQKREMLEKIANDAISQVVKTNRSFVLNPMTPYERRLIHMYVADDSRVTTDSTGSDNHRKVVVKPA